MKFYLKQNTCPTTSGKCEFFTVYGENGSLLYRFIGEQNSLTAKMVLWSSGGLEHAYVARVGAQVLSQYIIYTKSRKQVLVTSNMTAKGKAYRLKGVNWVLSGNLYTKNYELQEKNGTLVMKHSNSWKSGEEAFALDIQPGYDIDIALCIAAIVDSTLIVSKPDLVPV